MNRQQIVTLLDKPLDFAQVEKDFIELWSMIFDFSLGEVNYLKLSDERDFQSTVERQLAFILVGIARVLSKNIGDCPGDAKSYFAAACNFLEDIPVKEGERTHYMVKITSEDKTA